MFSGPKFLATLHKPSVYQLKRALPDEKRKEILKMISETSARAVVSHTNPLYGNAYELMKQEKIAEYQKYQNSFWWSPRYTPTHLKIFAILALGVSALLFYVRFIANPRHILELKRKLGIRFPQLEGSGYLRGWYEEYEQKDKLLEFEMHSLEDVEKLYKEGLLAKSKEETIKKIDQKKQRFLRGSKAFIAAEFKSK